MDLDKIRKSIDGSLQELVDQGKFENKAAAFLHICNMYIKKRDAGELKVPNYDDGIFGPRINTDEYSVLDEPYVMDDEDKKRIRSILGLDNQTASLLSD